MSLLNYIYVIIHYKCLHHSNSKCSHLPKIKNSCLVEIIYLLWGARKKAWVAFRAASCHANNWYHSGISCFLYYYLFKYFFSVKISPELG